MMADSQSEVFAFLSDPRNWPGDPERVEVIDTHGARVFLAGDLVLKVKRAVRLPYLDFSTLDLRKRYCEHELQINRAGAGSLYRDVIAITRQADGSLAIDGRGTPVEWAVRMNRFGQDDLLKSIAARNALTLELCDHLADAIARYHAAAAIAGPGAERIDEVAGGVLSSLARAAVPELREPLSAVEAGLAAALTKTRALRAQRAASGHVRRCHGDLHLANIVMWQGQPVLFDALEFDEALATIDTMYDLAFLLMDMERQNARAHANAILNRYLWRTRGMSDVRALALLPLFMALRAAVRALVALDRMAAMHDRAASLRASARETLDFAADLLHPPAARLIVVSGLSGTGKTTLAKSIAPFVGPAPGALHLRSDMERKALANVEPTERLDPSFYTRNSAHAVYGRILQRAEAALRAGHAVIIDAVMARPEERDDAERLAQRVGVVFAGLWLEGDEEILKRRVAQRTRDASDATPEIVERQLGYQIGPMHWPRLDAAHTPQQTLHDARLALGLAG